MRYLLIASAIAILAAVGLYYSGPSRQSAPAPQASDQPAAPAATPAAAQPEQDEQAPAEPAAQADDEEDETVPPPPIADTTIPDADEVAADREYMATMVEQGTPELAYDHACRVELARPGDGEAAAIIAYTRARNGDMIEAVAPMLQAVRTMPEDSFVLATAGQVCAWFDWNAREVAIDEATGDALEMIRIGAGDGRDFHDAYAEAIEAYKQMAAADLEADDVDDADQGNQALPPPPPAQVNIVVNRPRPIIIEQYQYTTVQVVFIGRIRDGGSWCGRVRHHDLLIDRGRHLYVYQAPKGFHHRVHRPGERERVVTNDARRLIRDRDGRMVTGERTHHLKADSFGIHVGLVVLPGRDDHDKRDGHDDRPGRPDGDKRDGNGRGDDQHDGKGGAGRGDDRDHPSTRPHGEQADMPATADKDKDKGKDKDKDKAKDKDKDKGKGKDADKGKDKGTTKPQRDTGKTDTKPVAASGPAGQSGAATHAAGVSSPPAGGTGSAMAHGASSAAANVTPASGPAVATAHVATSSQPQPNAQPAATPAAQPSAAPLNVSEQARPRVATSPATSEVEKGSQKAPIASSTQPGKTPRARGTRAVPAPAPRAERRPRQDDLQAPAPLTAPAAPAPADRIEAPQAASAPQAVAPAPTPRQRDRVYSTSPELQRPATRRERSADDDRAASRGGREGDGGARQGNTSAAQQGDGAAPVGNSTTEPAASATTRPTSRESDSRNDGGRRNRR